MLCYVCFISLFSLIFVLFLDLLFLYYSNHIIYMHTEVRLRIWIKVYHYARMYIQYLFLLCSNKSIWAMLECIVLSFLCYRIMLVILYAIYNAIANPSTAPFSSVHTHNSKYCFYLITATEAYFVSYVYIFSATLL